MKTYLVTIKNNSKRFTSIAELELAWQVARETDPRGGDWHDFCGYELDSLCRMHAHTMAIYPTNISCRKQSRVFRDSMGSSWHIHYKPVKQGDEANVRNYCMKERSPEIAEETSREHYLQIALKSINLFNRLKKCCL